MKLKEAVASLDDANDEHWTGAGLARVDVIEGLTGEQHTREEVDAIGRTRQHEQHGGSGSQLGDVDEPPTIGDDVMICWPEGQKFDGEQKALGKVLKIGDDGTLNVKVFGPNGGADAFFTGVRSKEAYDAAEENSPDRRLPWFEQDW